MTFIRQQLERVVKSIRSEKSLLLAYQQRWRQFQRVRQQLSITHSYLDRVISSGCVPIAKLSLSTVDVLLVDAWKGSVFDRVLNELIESFMQQLRVERLLPAADRCLFGSGGWTVVESSIFCDPTLLLYKSLVYSVLEAESVKEISQKASKFSLLDCRSFLVAGKDAISTEVLLVGPFLHDSFASQFACLLWRSFIAGNEKRISDFFKASLQQSTDLPLFSEMLREPNFKEMFFQPYEEFIAAKIQEAERSPSPIDSLEETLESLYQQQRKFFHFKFFGEKLEDFLHSLLNRNRCVDQLAAQCAVKFNLLCLAENFTDAKADLFVAILRLLDAKDLFLRLFVQLFANECLFNWRSLKERVFQCQSLFQRLKNLAGSEFVSRPLRILSDAVDSHSTSLVGSVDCLILTFSIWPTADNRHLQSDNSPQLAEYFRSAFEDVFSAFESQYHLRYSRRKVNWMLPLFRVTVGFGSHLIEIPFFYFLILNSINEGSQFPPVNPDCVHFILAELQSLGLIFKEREKFSIRREGFSSASIPSPKRFSFLPNEDSASATGEAKAGTFFESVQLQALVVRVLKAQKSISVEEISKILRIKYQHITKSDIDGTLELLIKKSFIEARSGEIFYLP